ncbi:hypothetical protein KO498_15770 [Lentibacter algarum]|uniref:hypothetical protein n=1 Tax=Lentibacter algarum TaxID=576131 RepID=UPI001C084E57|nr:hypothetical protein [Lentibacter algarum]MBU2983265.1 hypothetical protein [Lentibacter algarum]
MHDATLPLAINPTKILPPESNTDEDRASIYYPWFGALTSALSVAQSGILSVEGAAAVMRCSVDTVLRIPFDELASYDGPGRGALPYGGRAKLHPSS